MTQVSWKGRVFNQHWLKEALKMLNKGDFVFRVFKLKRCKDTTPKPVDLK